MSITPITTRRDQSDEHEVDFLKRELALSITSSILASMKYRNGNHQSAERSIIHADEACSTVFQYLSDPKRYNRLADKERLELTLEAELVKKSLQVIRRNGTNAR